MTDEMIKLGKRAVACKGWRWMPGMLSDEGRVVEINVYGLLVGYTTGIILKSGAQGWPCAWESSASLRLPDLSDPATLGCLLALVRQVRKSPAGSVCPHHVTVQPDPDFDVWSWYDSEQPRLIVMDGSTEAEAMVAALEAAL